MSSQAKTRSLIYVYNLMRSIREKREALELIAKNAHDALAALQNQCAHKGDLTYQYQGGGSGWDKSSDDYWMEWHCYECGKRWSTSQQNAYELTTKVHPNAKQVRK